MNNVLYVSTEHLASFAVDKDDILWGWGRSITGIFDKFTKEGFSIYPIKIMNDVSMVSANQTTLVVKKYGSLWGWGAYYYGQLCDRRYNKYFVDGIGNYKDGASFNVQYETEPIKIMDNVVYALSGRTCFAIKEGGSLWGWGSNSASNENKELSEINLLPKKIMEDVIYAAGNTFCTLALKKEGSLWLMGIINLIK